MFISNYVIIKYTFNEKQFQSVTQHASAALAVEFFWQILIPCSLFL